MLISEPSCGSHEAPGADRNVIPESHSHALFRNGTGVLHPEVFHPVPDSLRGALLSLKPYMRGRETDARDTKQPAHLEINNDALVVLLFITPSPPVDLSVSKEYRSQPSTRNDSQTNRVPTHSHLELRDLSTHPGLLRRKLSSIKS